MPRMDFGNNPDEKENLSPLIFNLRTIPKNTNEMPQIAPMNAAIHFNYFGEHHIRT